MGVVGLWTVRILVTGASGYVGSRLVDELRELDRSVECVVRDPSRVAFDASVVVHQADLLEPGSLEAIGGDYAAAFYLVHSMGRGGDANYEGRDVG